MLIVAGLSRDSKTRAAARRDRPPGGRGRRADGRGHRSGLRRRLQPDAHLVDEVAAIAAAIPLRRRRLRVPREVAGPGPDRRLARVADLRPELPPLPAMRAGLAHQPGVLPVTAGHVYRLPRDRRLPGPGNSADS